MPATSAVLTGLSLATGIAREATDGVPVVKQVLGVASRIVGLAEQIDKNREDLHALADRAKKMELTIARVVGDREPEEHLLSSLDDMNSVLRVVEKHFAKHIRQSRVRKTLRYIFTVRKEVDRLRGEFDDRLRELEFRNIRHSEIDLLRRITPSDNGQGDYKFNFHLAACEGSNQIVVVREMGENNQAEQARRRIEEHDNILERLSIVQNRHPNIAYLYGRNTGPKSSRFVVLKAGDIRSIHDLFGECKAEISVISRIIAKLADALCHLQKHAAKCMLFPGEGTNIYIDKNYEPKIGIQDDFQALSSVSLGYDAYIMQGGLKLILRHYSATLSSPENEVPCAHSKDPTWITDMVGTLIEAEYIRHHGETVFRRADIPSLIPLTQEPRMYLRQSNSRRADDTPDWWNTLLDLAIGGWKDEGSFLHAEYYPGWSGEHEYMDVYCVEDTADVVYHTTMLFKFPRSAANEIRGQLGIPPSADDPDGSITGFTRFYLQRSAGTCTGWRRELPSRNFP